MNARSRTALLLILIVALGLGTILLVHSRRAESLEELPGLAAEARPPLADDMQPDAADAIRTEAGGYAANPEPRTWSPDLAPPPGSHWLAGHVIFPPGVPADEAAMIVAKGRRFPSRISGKEHRVAVGSDGRFLVAFAEGTARGRLSLEARYLYLEEVLVVELGGAMEPELELEPALGGVIRGLARLAGRPLTEPFDPPPVRVYTSGLERSGGRIEGRANRWGRFELTGVPPGTRTLTARAPDCVDGSTEVEVLPGRVTEARIELQRGVRLAGRIVDPDGNGVHRARVVVETLDEEEKIAQSRDSSSRDGSFTVTGIVEGRIRVKVLRTGYDKRVLGLGELASGETIDDLRIELSWGPTIEGMVVWPDGSPAAGVGIEAVEMSDLASSYAAVDTYGKTRSDEAGRFRLTGLIGLEETEVELIARIRARGPARVDGEEAHRASSPLWIARRVALAGTAGVRVVLAPGESLRGRVVDDRGVPLESFTVSVKPGARASPEGESMACTFAPGDGFFLLEGLRHGEWTLLVKAPGFRSESRFVGIPHLGPDLEVTLRCHASIRGIVVDPGGVPVGRATVRARTGRGGAAGSSDERSDSTYTDAAGGFHLDAVPPGYVTVSASAEGFSGSERHHLRLQPAERAGGIELVLRAPSTITGQVHAAANRIDGREIEVLGPGGRYLNAVSDSTGKFELIDLHPGKYTLTLDPYGVEDEEWDGNGWAFSDLVIVQLDPGSSEHVVLGAPPEHPIRLRGRVTCAGEPLGGTWIACGLDWGDPSYPEQSTTCAADGTFELTVDGPGDYLFGFDTESGVDTVVSRSIPDQPVVELVFELPTGRLTGRIRTHDGRPAARCPLILRREDGEARGWAARRFARVENDGSFSLYLLSPGSYSLHAGWSGVWSYEGEGEIPGFLVLEGLELAPGEALTDVIVDLPRRGTIAGRVLDPGGTVVPSATITFNVPGQVPFELWPPVETDDTGYFRFPGAPVGSVQVQARKGERPTEIRSVEVAEGSVVEVVLQLRDP